MKKSKLLPLIGATATIAAFTPLMTLTSCNNVKYTEIPIDGTYTPTIEATTKTYTKDASGSAAATKDYFENSQVSTIIKEDVIGYLKGYVDQWGDVQKLIKWLEDNLPSVYAWLLEQLGDVKYLANLDALTEAKVGFNKINVATTNAATPYKLSTTIGLGGTAKLKHKQSGESQAEYGYVELNVKIVVSNLPYTMYFSNNNTWMAGIYGDLSSPSGWSIKASISSKYVNNEDKITESYNNNFSEWKQKPTDPDEAKLFETVRKCLQWDSAYLKNSN